MDQTDDDQGTIAITGATGFIGSHLLSRLNDLKQPNRALIRPRRDRKNVVPGFTKIVEGSLQDQDALSALLSGARTCIHAAGATKSIDSSGFHAANVVGTYDFAACAAACGVSHLIYLSSQAARAPHVSHYAASKAISESALQSFQSEMKITIIRPPAVIGPGDPMLQPMFDLIKRGWLPAPAASKAGAPKFAVISVRDLVDQTIAIVQSPEGAAAMIEPCSIASTDWRAVADAASEVLARNVRLVRVSPGLLKTLGYAADGLSQLVRRPMPISHGKVQEMLAADWTYDRAPQDAMKLQEIMRDCLLD